MSDSDDSHHKQKKGKKVKSQKKAHKKFLGDLYDAYMNGSRSQVSVATAPSTELVSDLLSKFAQDRGWSKEQLDADLHLASSNRLTNVTDLRLLSQQSWDKLPFLPIVKDLLKIASDGVTVPLPQVSVSAPPCLNLAPSAAASGTNVSDSPSSSSLAKSANIFTAEICKSISGLSLDSTAIKPLSATKIEVTTASGKKYEADRLCPHKGVDLVGGKVQGDNLICPKHKWEFDLAHGGVCVKKGPDCATLNAIALDW